MWLDILIMQMQRNKNKKNLIRSKMDLKRNEEIH